MPFSLYFESEDFDALNPGPATDTIPQTEFSGRGFDRVIVDSVWSFAEEVEGNDSDLWRKDEFGAWIHRLDYGKRNSEFGWEICDLGAAGRQGGDIIAMRPIQWQNYIDQVALLTQGRVTAKGRRNERQMLES